MGFLSFLRKISNKEKEIFISEERFFSLLERVSAFDVMARWVMSPVRCSPPCWSVNAWRSNYPVRAWLWKPSGKITPSVMNIRPQSCPKNAGVIRWWICIRTADSAIRSGAVWCAGRREKIRPTQRKTSATWCGVNVTVYSCKSF